PPGGDAGRRRPRAAAGPDPGGRPAAGLRRPGHAGPPDAVVGGVGPPRRAGRRPRARAGRPPAAARAGPRRLLPPVRRCRRRSGMSGPPPPSWPTSRVLAGWRPHLERFRPRSLWLYHLLLHRVEVPVAIARPAGHGRLTGVLLGALAAAPEAPLGRLAGGL